MTNKEIISNLRGLIGKYNLTDEEWQTVEKTIEVLSNSDEDRISREWVLEHQRIVVDDDGIMLPVVDVSIVKKAPNIQPKLKYVAVANVNFDKDELQKIVDEAIPTIMPEIEYRKAHWQNNACSNCGIYNASAYKNWCPNCGCQMTEEIE
jgi:hypothetical protein